MPASDARIYERVIVTSWAEYHFLVFTISSGHDLLNGTLCNKKWG